jgi:septal ring factor EnvC (AmiA/AmiB activator)
MSTDFSLNPDSPKASEGDQKESSKMSPDSKIQLLGVLLTVVFLVAAGIGFYAWSLDDRIQQMESAMQTQFSSHGESIQALQDHTGVLDEDFDTLHTSLTAAETQIGNTQGQLTQARQLTEQIAKQQKAAAEELSQQLGQLQTMQENTVGTVGDLSSDVSAVKEDFSAAKQDITSTRSDLQRAFGDLGVQSGLIARNREELAELKLRGDRDYIEFDLRKADVPQKYGAGIALQLKKTDVKRQKYTINLLADDLLIEKKDKNTNEPVQFYQQGFRIPSEIVVNQIHKDRIVGYISVPKQRSGTQLSSQADRPVEAKSRF